MARKFSIIFMVIAVGVIFFQACEGDLNHEGYEQRTFSMSGHPDWPPIMSQEGNEIVGAGPELAFLILDELGLLLESRHVGT